jgi:hypothetical protein
MKNLYLAIATTLLTSACSGPETAPPIASALPVGLWEDATEATIGATADWTNKVDLADLNGDGMVDILFANGGNYREPGDPVFSTVFLNQGPGKPFQDATAAIFGDEPMLCRVIKTADVNADGNIDIFFGATFHTVSRLLLGTGGGVFNDVSKTHLPEHALSLGDVEFGDADLDGDLDLVLADWGEGNPMKNEGGTVKLWLNDGDGKFVAAAGSVPAKLIRFSWDIEFADLDGDYDLDLMVSSKLSEGGSLFLNDGTGTYTDITEEMLPQLTNNYEFEPIDLNGDGFLDTFTINDGGLFEGQKGSHKESVFFGTADGGFRVATAEAFPDSENLGFDDNRIIAFDYDSDGDVDILIGSLSGPDRIAINDGAGHFQIATEVVIGPESKGTLGVQAADLNGDGKIDLAMAQGEVKGHEADMVFFGTNIPKDTAAPKIEMLGLSADGCIRARIHDNKSPTRPFDFESVVATVDGSSDPIPMVWYGEHMWRACPGSAPEDNITVVATDIAGMAATESIDLQ